MANYAYDQTLGKPVYFDDISAQDVPKLKTHLYTCIECGLPMYLRYGDTMGAYWAHGPYTTNSGWNCKLLTDYSPNKSKEKTREERIAVLKQWYKDKKITMEEVQGAYERLLDLFKESESEALRQVAEANLEKQRLKIALKRAERESQETSPFEIKFDRAVRELEGYRRFVEEEVIFIGKPPSSFHFDGQFMEDIIIPDWIESPIKEKLNYLLENKLHTKDVLFVGHNQKLLVNKRMNLHLLESKNQFSDALGVAKLSYSLISSKANITQSKISYNKFKPLYVRFADIN